MNKTVKKIGAITTATAVAISFAATPTLAYDHNNHKQYGNNHNNGNKEQAYVYKADLTTLNDSGVDGYATITLTGDKYTVTVKADGFEQGKEHPQHIHGFADRRDSVSPTSQQDTNNDGIISLEEGLVTYGPIMQSLTPFQTAENGSVNYTETFTVDRSSDDKNVTPLDKREIVLHGKTVNGEYNPVLPVASGEIEYVKTIHDQKNKNDYGYGHGRDNRGHGYGHHKNHGDNNYQDGYKHGSNGNGYGSRNNIDVRSSNTTQVSQSNTNRVNNDIRVDANTGNNRSDFNTGGSSFISSGDALQSIELFNGGGFNFFNR